MLTKQLKIMADNQQECCWNWWNRVLFIKVSISRYNNFFLALGEPGVLNIDRVKLWSLQLARALHYCHDIHKVVHRDVKVEK